MATAAVFDLTYFYFLAFISDFQVSNLLTTFFSSDENPCRSFRGHYKMTSTPSVDWLIDVP